MNDHLPHNYCTVSVYVCSTGDRGDQFSYGQSCGFILNFLPHCSSLLYELYPNSLFVSWFCLLLECFQYHFQNFWDIFIVKYICAALCMWYVWCDRRICAECYKALLILSVPSGIFLACEDAFGQFPSSLSHHPQVYFFSSSWMLYIYYFIVQQLKHLFFFYFFSGNRLWQLMLRYLCFVKEPGLVLATNTSKYLQENRFNYYWLDTIVSIVIVSFSAVFMSSVRINHCCCSKWFYWSVYEQCVCVCVCVCVRVYCLKDHMKFVSE